MSIVNDEEDPKGKEEIEAFQRRIVERANHRDGSQVIMLECGHVVTMITPLSISAWKHWCAQCVQNFIKEKRKQDEGQK